MISASTTISVLISSIFIVHVCVDSKTVLRLDRIDEDPAWIYRMRNKAEKSLVRTMKIVWYHITCRVFDENENEHGYQENSETQPLLR